MTVDRLRGRAGLACALLVVMAGAAFGAEAAPVKPPFEAVFVAEIVALLLVGRLFGEIMLRLGQPAVVGQLLAGVVLGPSVFGLLLPHWHALIFPADQAQKAMIDGVARLGVLMLLLLTGMETDVALVRAVGRPAAAVSVTGIAVPFACGLLLGLYGLPDTLLPSPGMRLVTALFLGTALSISSIKIVAMVIDEMHFMRRNLGQIIVASAIIDDTIGWVIVAITFGVARPGGASLGSLAVSVGGTLLFLAVSATLGRRLVAGLIRWSNDHLVSELPTITVILIVMGLMALLTDAIGVNTVLGAFVAGVLVGQSPILTKQVERELRGLVVALFAPVFFGIAGLGTDLTILKDPVLLGLTGGLILIASLGKFGGAFLGGKLGGLSRPESLALALGMNARGSTEVIVASIGLSLGALNGTLFTMIVTMAVVTTMAMPPTLRWALKRLPIGREEAERLEREAFDAKGFVSNLERLLLAEDGSASGRLASRLAGLVGGAGGLPITVIPLVADPGEAAATDHVADVLHGARTARAHEPSEAAAASEPDVTLRPAPTEAAEATVGIEARKGYGLLMIGVEPATVPDGGLHPNLTRVIGSFAGARAVVVARGVHRTDPAQGPLRLLLPTTGTDASRRAAELAFALARAQAAEVTVLHVAEPPGRSSPRGTAREPARTDLLVDTAEIGRRFEVEAKMLVRQSEQRDAAILGQARRAGDTLIVLGVTPRSSERMPFGPLVAALLEGSQASLLLIINDSSIGVASSADEL